jgi:aspartokinase-like uncharacterized kinase
MLAGIPVKVKRSASEVEISWKIKPDTISGWLA